MKNAVRVARVTVLKTDSRKKNKYLLAVLVLALKHEDIYFFTVGACLPKIDPSDPSARAGAFFILRAPPKRIDPKCDSRLTLTPKRIDPSLFPVACGARGGP